MFHSDKDVAERLKLFHSCLCADSYEIMGAQKCGDAVIFRVWAPNAQSVSVAGDFNFWSPTENPMFKVTDGIWETKIYGVNNFDRYKYAVTDREGYTFLKNDPYARHFETAPDNSSRVYFSDYTWEDGAWTQPEVYSAPLNIYEVHLESWRRHEDGNTFSYEMLAEELSRYIKDMGYTHIELMPITEYPFSGSWGYQVTGYFAPTSRFGTPDDFKRMVDIFHRNGIGVILDWVPAHFPKNSEGLYRFDGTPIFEYPDERRGEHKQWGTCVFDYGRVEVINFLLSSAVMFLKDFHIDGIRVDAVASMLYLDYNRGFGEWVPNNFGGNEHIEAVEFIRRLNEACFSVKPNVLMIAEESTAWPKVTRPTDWEGLGFNLKWNMGWMNDTLRYISLDPIYRRFDHDLITFSFMYAFSENYILPLSHDEVVHGKGSLINRMWGWYEDKFASLRAYLTYYMLHPGKKLLFMGQEFAQFDEWDYKKQLDWFLLEFDAHSSFKSFVKALNRFYLETPELFEQDFSQDGFAWISGEDSEGSVICFERIAKKGERVIAVCNFTPVERKNYHIGAEKGEYEIIFSSDWDIFGGKSTMQKNLKILKLRFIAGRHLCRLIYHPYLLSA